MESEKQKNTKVDIHASGPVRASKGHADDVALDTSSPDAKVAVEINPKGEDSCLPPLDKMQSILPRHDSNDVIVEHLRKKFQQRYKAHRRAAALPHRKVVPQGGSDTDTIIDVAIEHDQPKDKSPTSPTDYPPQVEILRPRPVVSSPHNQAPTRNTRVLDIGKKLEISRKGAVPAQTLPPVKPPSQQPSVQKHEVPKISDERGIGGKMSMQKIYRRRQTSPLPFEASDSSPAEVEMATGSRDSSRRSSEAADLVAPLKAFKEPTISRRTRRPTNIQDVMLIVKVQRQFRRLRLAAQKRIRQRMRAARCKSDEFVSRKLGEKDREQADFIKTTMSVLRIQKWYRWYRANRQKKIAQKLRMQRARTFDSMAQKLKTQTRRSPSRKDSSKSQSLKIPRKASINTTPHIGEQSRTQRRATISSLAFLVIRIQQRFRERRKKRQRRMAERFYSSAQEQETALENKLRRAKTTL